MSNPEPRVDSDRTVWVSPSTGRSSRGLFLHMSDDCPQLDDTDAIDRDRGCYPADVQWCSICAGRKPTARCKDNSHWLAAKNADPEGVFSDD